MVETSSLRLLFPRPLRELPADLAALLAVVVATNVTVFVPVLRETPLRILFGLAFVLFVPGYAFVAALFPDAGESSATGTENSDRADADPWTDSTRTGLDGLERIALSLGLSIAIVPLVVLVLNFTPWGIRLVPIAIALNGVTLVSIAIAAARRQNLPQDERFRVPYRAWIAAGRSEVLGSNTRADAALNVVLVLSILLAVGAVGYAIAVPQPGEQFSAVYVLTEDDDGSLVAGDFPTELEPGESEELILGIDNNEHRTTEYTVVAVEQDVEIDGNETIVHEQRELERLETELSHDETWHHPFDLEPTIVGENVRIAWLLYPEDVPDEPSIENTEYYAHLWITVDESD
ncbi:DUF1616 domain-containing protein [Natronoglomus mannanivorans]|uniref:DUF1616 domain-containing protein n=1 Tax=Natronoglomus mannanivorans TaxID=2979990 RepID=A0AAP2YZW0_9EURY|nr:DUF1616 domain-containing protein [Halobacteria archaeon AArc-xg1-1]